jgi:hypothetical protein
MTDQSTPELEDVLQAFVDAGTGKMHTSIPGEVLSYDDSNQTATVQPVIRSRFEDPDTGENEYVLPPPISNVPVEFPGGGGVSFTWPLSKGDTVRLVFAERSIDEWKATGNNDNTAQDARRFDITDAVAVPGLRSPADPLESTAVDSDDVVVTLPNEIVFGDATVTTYLARADRVEDEINDLRTAFEDLRSKYNAHKHPNNGVVSDSPDTSGAPAVGSTASDKVRGK